MVEHVGRENYQLFIDSVSQVMKDGGAFLLHFISALKEHPGDAFHNGIIDLHQILVTKGVDNDWPMVRWY